MPEPELDLDFIQNGQITIATIVHAKMLDATNVRSFGDKAIAHIESNPNTKLLVNFEHIQYMSSAGLTELLRMNEALKPSGHVVHLFGLNKDIYNVFRITNLHTVFTIHTTDTLDEAAQEFNNAPNEPETLQPGTEH
jgi:anti-sigma B factor antagonist